MIGIIYIIIAFIFFFISFKKREKEYIEQYERYGLTDCIFDTDILLQALLALLWGIVLPLRLIWKLLNLTYNKFNKQ